jgi:hypothetical protein
MEIDITVSSVSFEEALTKIVPPACASEKLSRLINSFVNKSLPFTLVAEKFL